MTRNRELLLLAAMAGMDLSWLHVWTVLILQSTYQRLLSPAVSLGILSLAVVLTLAMRTRGLRLYQVIGIQLLAVGPILLLIVHAIDRPGQALFDWQWLAEFFTIPRTPGRWLLLVLAIGWLSGLWLAGIRLALQPRDHQTVAGHFDLGIIALLLAHLVETMLAIKGGIMLSGVPLTASLCAFLVFSVPAFSLARCAGPEQNSFAQGFRGIGAALSILALSLLMGSGLTALFLPWLTMAAETGVEVLQTAATPVGNLLVAIISFIYGPGRLRSEPAAGPAGRDTESLAYTAPPVDGWLGWLQQVLLVLVAGAGVLLVCLICVLVLWQLGWWLAQRTAKTPAGPSPWQRCVRLFQRMAAALLHLGRQGGFWRQRRSDPILLYLALVKWGGRSGIALRPGETPLAYGRRLAVGFPQLTGDIDTIVNVHGEAVYQEGEVAAELLRRAHRASRRLASPRLWPIRLLALLRR